MLTVGTTAVLRYGSDLKWHYIYLPSSQAALLSYAADGTPSLRAVGATSGQIPTVPIPLSCMALNLVAPMQSDGLNVSIAPATESAAGSMSASDKTRLDNLAAVAISGSYLDLSNRPSIPSAQVNSDWNASSGVAQILNKPTLGTAAAQSISAFATAAQGSLAASALQPGASIPWSTITGQPTTISGYGIIDGVSSSGSYANPSWITSLPWSKITGTPTTRSGYGITDAQPLNSSLTALAALSTTGTIYYLSAASTWTGVTIGTGLAFSGGTLSSTLAGGTVTSVGISGSDFTFTGSPVTTSGTIAMALAASGVSAGTYTGVTVTAKGIVTAGTSRSFSNTASRSVSTTNNTANGFQLSITQDCHVTYIASIQTTSTIGGPSSGTIVLEICAANSSIGSNWTTIAQLVNNQTITLAVALQSVQLIVANLTGIVPAGYYARVRSVTPSGTVTYNTTVSGQECLL